MAAILTTRRSFGATATLLLVTVAALSTGRAAAAPAAISWSAQVVLGPSDPGSPSLDVNASGHADLEFGYAPNGPNAVGTIYTSTSVGGAPWPVAVAAPGTNQLDSRSPAVAVDPAGNGTDVFAASQIDGLSSAYVQGSESAAGVWGGHGVIGAPASTMAAQVRMDDSSPSSPTPVTVAAGPRGCGLAALGQATITGECISNFQFALDPTSGRGLVVWRTSAGAVDAATRSANGVWSSPARLAPAALSVASSIDAAGTETVAFTVGKVRTTTIQVWTVDANAGQTWGAPVQISSSACTPSVTVNRTAVGTALVAFGQAGHLSCDAAVSSTPAGGPTGATQVLTKGAHISSLVATTTPAGSFVVAWDSGARLYVTTGSGRTFAVPTALGPAGAPAVAAGGGWANVGWCSAQCRVSAAPVP